MNVRVTTFSNPFSFYCKVVGNEEDDENFFEDTNIGNGPPTKTDISDLKHGQYVAVLWNNKWSRGIVSMETQFLVWLIDYGTYLRPNEKTVCVNLPVEQKKYPTKVFEASIHGVVPVDKVLTDFCELKNEICTEWNKGAAEHAKNLIQKAVKVFFVPISILSTKFNDIVIGDLYLQTSATKVVNIVDELQLWPVFLQKNKKQYIENLSVSYTSRRRHRACTLKPDFPDDLPTMSFQTTLAEYSAICETMPDFNFSDCESESRDGSIGSTVVDGPGLKEKPFRLTVEEIEKYSNMYVTVCGREYNILNVLVNKLRDLNICEKYKNAKSVGRANHRTRYISFNNQTLL